VDEDVLYEQIHREARGTLEERTSRGPQIGMIDACMDIYGETYSELVGGFERMSKEEIERYKVHEVTSQGTPR
jgi:hypothetical protein